MIAAIYYGPGCPEPMSDWLKIALTAFATIVVGVVVFAVTRIAERVLLDPVHEQRKVIGEIDSALTYWAWAYSNPGPATPDREKAMDEIRSLAGRLGGATNVIRCWRVASWLGAVDRAACHEAGGNLFGISNQMLTSPDMSFGEWGRHNRRSAARIRELLRIPALEPTG
jgi:hypothetical protein